MALYPNFESKGNIVILWQSALRWRDKDPKGPTADKPLQSVDVQKMLLQLRADSVKDALFFKGWDSERDRLGIPDAFGAQLPRGGG